VGYTPAPIGAIRVTVKETPDGRVCPPKLHDNRVETKEDPDVMLQASHDPKGTVVHRLTSGPSAISIGELLQNVKQRGILPHWSFLSHAMRPDAASANGAARLRHRSVLHCADSEPGAIRWCDSDVDLTGGKSPSARGARWRVSPRTGQRVMYPEQAIFS